MIPLLFIGDGERDEVTIPRLAEKVLGCPIRGKFHRWVRFHKPRENRARSRLQFAYLQAQDAKAVGIIAVVDTDKDPQRVRLRDLRKERDVERAVGPPFPTALGEAVPHGEAWLLDDPVAVRRALALAAEHHIPTIRQAKRPKDVLEELLRKSERADVSPGEVWADIAGLVDLPRCCHARETGFHQFVEDVRHELRPFVKS
jgi:hypothetical protein